KLLPSNAGAGYVLRRLIRRAVRHGRTLGLTTDDLLKIASMYIDDIYAESYPLLVKNREFVLTELKKEIARFESTLENGMKEFRKILDQKVAEKQKEVDGKSAFYLYDTFGFPIELTVELAEEEGLTVDEEGFAAAMEEQKQKARDNQNFSAKLSASDANLFEVLDESIVTEFVGYDSLTAESEIVCAATDSELVDVLSEGTQGTIIVPVTPFYATMGGQKGDIGEIKTASGVFEVTDTVKLPGNRVGHVGKVVSGQIKKGEKATLTVDSDNRNNTCRNHSATHLMQKALKEVLGDHVEQQGSYQDSGRTRFDFSHSQAMSSEEIAKVESLVNEKIAEDLDVKTDIMGIEEAKASGAMALFGEKYGDSVRVVSMGDFSKELCGGTHVKHTGDIAAFKILSESGVAAGVRRIEALTGANVFAYYKEMEENFVKAAAAAKATPATLLDKIQHMQAELKALSSENESLKSKAAKEALGDVMNQVVEVKGVKLLATSVADVDMNGLRDLGDQLKEKLGEGVVVLASNKDGKVNLVAMVTEGAMAKGAHAGNLIKGIAALVGGGGGGRPNMAQAGGKNPDGIPAAVAQAATVLEGQL
ncbi:MAG: alanine--tRNA ligase, partial [Lachnospiraceae bacterium]